MLNQPLTRDDHGKLLIFALLLAPTVIFIIGIIPTILLVFGLYSMKKNQDFSSVDRAVQYFRAYVWLLVIGFGLGSIIGAISWGFGNDDFYAPFIVAVIAIGFLFAVNPLFYDPLRNHRKWVEINGVFSTIAKSDDIEIIKGEKLRQYSVADELLKWAKLKEDGHISEDEFNKARAKLVKRKLQ